MVKKTAADSTLPKGTFQTRIVTAISAGHAVHDTYTAFLPPLLPLFIIQFNLSKTEAGLLSVFLQIPSLLQFLIGHLADRGSLKWLVISAPGVSAVSMSLLGIAPHYAGLAFLLLVAGLSSAGFHATAPVIAGRLSGTRLGQGMGFWMLGGELGRTLGPLIIVAAVGLVTLQGMPLLMPFGLLASFLLYVQLKGIPEPHSQKRERLKPRVILSRITRFFLPLSGLILLRGFAMVAISVYLPIYLSEKGSSLFMAGASLTIVEAAGVIGALTGGWLSDKAGRKTMLTFSFLATPILLLIFLQAESWLQIILLILLGLSALSITPVIMALVQESFPENRALANGIYMTLSFVLRSGAVVVVGAMGDKLGLTTAFQVSAYLLLPGLIFIYFLPSFKK
ncbi:MAG: hypothetical protein Kow0042_17990 [Calditrichia bacterium]